jgi:hypothetical protein
MVSGPAPRSPYPEAFALKGALMGATAVGRREAIEQYVIPDAPRTVVDSQVAAHDPCR